MPTPSASSPQEIARAILQAKKIAQETIKAEDIKHSTAKLALVNNIHARPKKTFKILQNKLRELSDFSEFDQVSHTPSEPESYISS